MKKRKALTILNHNTYFLTCWRWRYNYRDRLQEKKTRCFEMKERKKTKETKERKKWTKGALGASYIAIVPMDLPTDY